MKKIKKYSEFINEGYSNTDIKSALLSHFDENKGEIKSKGMDFESMRENLSNTLNSLDSNFLEKVTQDFSNVSNIDNDGCEPTTANGHPADSKTGACKGGTVRRTTYINCPEDISTTPIGSGVLLR